MTIDLWGKISRKNAPASDRTGLQEPLVGHWRDLPPRREGFPSSHSGAFLPRQHETFLPLSFTASFHPRHYLTFQLLVTARSSPLVATRFFPSRHCEAFPFLLLRGFPLLVIARHEVPKQSTVLTNQSPPRTSCELYEPEQPSPKTQRVFSSPLTRIAIENNHGGSFDGRRRSRLEASTP